VAGMSIVVCLPGEALTGLYEAIPEALAPFELDFTRGEELDIWDHWTIRGTDEFVPLPGYEDDPRLVRAPSEIPRAPGCAGGPRGVLNFSANAAQAAELAGAAWDRWHDLARSLPGAMPSQWFFGRVNADGFSTRRAHALHRAQPLVKAFDESLKELQLPGYAGGFLRFIDPVTQVGLPEGDHFVRWQLTYALPRWNVLTLDGWWHEDGGPGIHGACHSPSRCPHEPQIPEGQDFVNAYLRALPDDVLLVNVHCHV
jgi:hypothetical protein